MASFSVYNCQPRDTHTFDMASVSASQFHQIQKGHPIDMASFSTIMDIRRAWNGNPTTTTITTSDAPIHHHTFLSNSDHLTITDIQDRMDIDSAETDIVMSDLTLQDEEEHPLDADNDTAMTGAPRYNSPCGSPCAPAPAVTQNALGAQYINGPLKRPQSMPHQAKRPPPPFKHRLDRDHNTIMTGVTPPPPSSTPATRPYRHHRLDRDRDTVMTGVPSFFSPAATRPYRHRLDRDNDTIMTGAPSYSPAPAKPRYRQQQQKQHQQSNRPASGPNKKPQAASRSPPRRNPYPTPPPTPRPSPPSGPAAPASSPSSSGQRERYQNQPRMSKKGANPGAGRSKTSYRHRHHHNNHKVDNIPSCELMVLD